MSIIKNKKYFSILGDSVSTLDGYSYPEYASYYSGARKFEANIFSPADTWWGQVIDRLGGELLVNNSFSGSTVCFDPCYEIQSYGCSEERTSGLARDGLTPDVIMIFMGINDWGRGTKLIGKDSSDPSCFSGAYDQMLKRLKINYPGAELWCFTLPIGTCSRDDEFAFPYCRGGVHIDEYCKVIRDCARKNGAKLIDIYGAEPYDTVDGFHPDSTGMRTLSTAVLALPDNE